MNWISDTRKSRRATTSKPAVGSSRISRSGSAAIARAKATEARWPTERRRIFLREGNAKWSTGRLGQFGFRLADEDPQTRPAVDNPLSLEFGVRMHNRVGVDHQRTGQLADEGSWS